MSIVATASVSDFFEEVVEDAMRSRGVSASEGATVYVVELLADFAKPGSPVERTLEKSLTLLLDEALHTTELGERFESCARSVTASSIPRGSSPITSKRVASTRSTSSVSDGQRTRARGHSSRTVQSSRAPTSSVSSRMASDSSST